MIYINGIKASKKDLEVLQKIIKQGILTVSAHFTKKGNLAITTNF